MNLKEISRKDNQLLERQELVYEASGFAATPTRAELRGATAKELGTDEKLVFVTAILQKFGEQIAEVRVSAYKSEQAAGLEPMHIAKRHEPKKAKEDAAGTAVKQAAPAPKAEEKKPEEKK